MFTPFQHTALPRASSLNLNSKADMAFASHRMASSQLAEPPHQARNMLRTESEGLTRRTRSKAQQSVRANSVITDSQETLRRLVDISDKVLPANLSGSGPGLLDGLSACGSWYDSTRAPSQRRSFMGGLCEGFWQCGS